MSNPTELPDLDACPFCGGPARIERSAMWLDLVCDHDKACILDGDSAEMSYQHAVGSLEAMVAKWNRRAQPEGEAPQAEPVAHIYPVDEGAIPDWPWPFMFIDGAANPAIRDALGAFPVFPAAQHAESGAQASDDIEAAARAIYELLPPCQGKSAKDFPWQPGGNSMKQEEARDYARAALAAQSQGAQAAHLQEQAATMLTPLDYRAQGREEALAIILAESAEDPFSEYTGWSKSGAPDDEGGAYWKEDELRALLHIGDRAHDAYGRAEAMYWEALGRKDEAARELLFAQQAPFYKPLHDFLSKNEAWDLMGDLKRAQQVAAPGHETIVREGDGLVCTACGTSAPGTPEAPTADTLDAARYRWLCQHGHERMPEAVLEAMDAAHYEGEPMPKDLIDQVIDKERAAQLDGGQGEAG